MSQFDFATIDPNAKSGTQLAVDLNNWRDALHSGHRGAERPAYAQGGILWVRETSSEQWDLMLYDGDTDFVLRSVNPTTNQLLPIPKSAVDGLGSAATRDALGVDGAVYSQDSILGTVSQDAGVPTGAIIQRISNANGEAIRYADGTQVCYKANLDRSGSSGAVVWTYPAAFLDGNVSVTATAIATASRNATVSNITATAVSTRVFKDTGAEAATNICIEAKGRWF